jgi:hypothetical protein
VVFDIVVGAPVDVLRNDGPLVSVHLVVQEKQPFLVVAPYVFFDSRIQMIMPSLNITEPFSTLFADSSRQVVRDLGPLHWSQFIYKFDHLQVLCLGPRSC